MVRFLGEDKLYNQYALTIRRNADTCVAPVNFPNACDRPLYAMMMVVTPQCIGAIKALNYNGTVCASRSTHSCIPSSSEKRLRWPRAVS